MGDGGQQVWVEMEMNIGNGGNGEDWKLMGTARNGEWEAGYKWKMGNG